MKHQLAIFREDVQIFGTRCDSYSTKRVAEQAGVKWEVSDFGITIRRQVKIDAAGGRPARVRDETVAIPWENVRLLETIEERDVEQDDAKDAALLAQIGAGQANAGQHSQSAAANQAAAAARKR